MLLELEKFYKNKKILITGNTGFKGSWLTLILSSLKFLEKMSKANSCSPSKSPLPAGFWLGDFNVSFF